MPRGNKPKVYHPWLVAEIRRLYEEGRTQHEVGEILGLSQKVVYTVMKNHGLKTRPRTKRDQCGPANSSWKGDEAAYAAMHKRVEVARGTPQRCSCCDTTDPDETYHWANLTGNYQDVRDYARMCTSCHRTFDTRRRRE